MGSDVHFLGESVPVLDDEEMENLYRHFLLDDMPEEDDGDEDFEPPPVDEEEEGEEAGVRRRNIQARELNDLVQDAYKQLGPSDISPGLRERVLDQLSMHFQLLVQTGILAAKVSSAHGDQEMASLGMLEHLACGSGKTGRQALRTRSRVKTNSMCWDLDDDGLSPVGIPGLLPPRSLRHDITIDEQTLLTANRLQEGPEHDVYNCACGPSTQEAGRVHCPNGNVQAAVERLMVSRGAVVWPQLLPRHCGQERDCGLRSNISSSFRTQDIGAASMCPSRSSGASPSFSMVEDRLLCRGTHLHGVDWETIKANFLPHRPTRALMHRYTVLSGWASVPCTMQSEPVSQVCSLPWTQQEDLELMCAVQERAYDGPSDGLFMHRHGDADRDGKERVEVQISSRTDKSSDRRHTVPFQKSRMEGLGSSSGPLFGAWSPAVEVIQFGGTRCATMGGLPKVASILRPSPGKLTVSKSLLSGAGTAKLGRTSQPTTGHHDQSDGASRKRRLLNVSTPDPRWGGDESCGDGCDAMRPRYPVPMAVNVLPTGVTKQHSCSRTETSALSGQSRMSDGVAYAEDELSDDDRPSEVQGASRHVQPNERRERMSSSNPPGNTHSEHRYEEDELSDDLDS